MDSGPMRLWLKEMVVCGTIVQRDIGTWRLLSKEAFTSDKLAHIDYFRFICSYHIDL